MTQLLYFAVTVLSLGVIFGAGWASGVGTIKSNAYSVEKTNIVLTDDTDNGTDGDKCPDCPENPEDCDMDEDMRHKFGFKFRIPLPPHRGNKPHAINSAD